jgi:hypothetical protein
MRLTDGPATSAEVLVSALASRVWAVTTDITAPARFGGELEAAAWLDGADRPRVGARFTGRNRNDALGVWETTSVVTACAPEEAFGWDVYVDGAPEPGASWRFDLRPLGAATLLRLGVRLGPGHSHVRTYVARHPDREEHVVAVRLAQLDANIRRTLDGVRAAAEAPRTAPAAAGPAPAR